jgi:hypothetical protein
MSAKTNTAPSLSFGAFVLRVGLGVVAGCAREYFGEGYLQKGDVAKTRGAADGDRRPLWRALRRL